MNLVAYARHFPKGASSSITPPPPQSSTQPPPVNFLSNMTREEITTTMHHPGSTLPAVRPCDTPNGSDTQVHWASEQIHRITGCRRLKNYKQLLQVTSDGKWVDTGEFPMSLGTYSTSAKPPEASRSTVHYTATWIKCTSTSALATPLLWGVPGMSLSLLIVPPATTGSSP